MRQDLLNLLPANPGHFLLESGHHGDLWLDLERLCLRPALLRPLISELAGLLRSSGPEIVCGPLVEGAFIALLVSLELDLPFVYTERFVKHTEQKLFPSGYQLPDPLRATVHGKRVAIVNDVINAGSAVRGTLENLESCGAAVAAIGTLAVLGQAAQQFASGKNVALHALDYLANNLWEPTDCPLCASQLPLSRPVIK